MLLKQIEDAGLRVAGRSGDDQLVEIIEVPNHPWFVACQFLLLHVMVTRCLLAL
jgi:CTP synthase